MSGEMRNGPSQKPPPLERREGDISPEFFDLQLKFAQALQKKTGKPLEDILLTHTNLAQRFFEAGAAQTREQKSEAWGRYIAGLETTKDQLAWTYQFYQQMTPERGAASEGQGFGCFQFHDDGDAIHIHFSNADRDGSSPLSEEKTGRRMNDLRAMFAHIREKYPNAKVVRGESWLYNTEAYKRLFPASYTEIARVADDAGFRLGRRWGQFLDFNGNLKKEFADQLLKNTEGTPIEKLADAFPLQTLSVETPIENFYKHLGIEGDLATKGNSS